MMTPTSNGKVPEWLRSRWERTKCETAARVRAAVDQLQKQGRDVTFESIREAIRSLHGVSISANTIKRNELAYKVYLANCITSLRRAFRKSPVMSQRSPACTRSPVSGLTTLPR